VHEDDHHVGHIAGVANSCDEARGVADDGDTGGVLASGPVLSRVRSGVVRAVGAEDCERRPSNIDDGRRERVVRIRSDPDHLERGIGGDSGEGIRKSFSAEVHPVVVGHGRHVDTGRSQRTERRGRCLEGEAFRLGVSAGADGGLEVDDGQVGRRELRGDRGKRGSWVGQPWAQLSLEVDVPRKGEGDRARFRCRCGDGGSRRRCRRHG
jgi:hypothetical protein